MRLLDGTPLVLPQFQNMETNKDYCLCDKNNTFHELNVNDETRGTVPEEVGEILGPKTLSDDNRTLITQL